MTIIIALKDKKNKRIIIGADKQGTLGQCKVKVPTKIFSLPVDIVDGYGEVIDTAKIHIGISGYGFLKHFLQYGFNIPQMNEHQEFIEYLYQTFLPCLREVLTENQLVDVNNNSLDTESYMIMVFKGEIYRVENNFGVDVIDEEYYINGSGYEVALGSLYTNLTFHNNLNRIEIVKQAIRAASATTIYCSGEVDLKVINY